MRGSNTCELVFDELRDPGRERARRGQRRRARADERPGHRAPRALRRPDRPDAGRDGRRPALRARAQAVRRADRHVRASCRRRSPTCTPRCSPRARFAYMVAQRLRRRRASRASMPAACLLHASENAVQVALEAIQALGGNGYINEYPAGRLLRDAKLYEIGAGTNEIRRMLIGRELFDGGIERVGFVERLQPRALQRHRHGSRLKPLPHRLVCRTATNGRIIEQFRPRPAPISPETPMSASRFGYRHRRRQAHSHRLHAGQVHGGPAADAGRGRHQGRARAGGRRGRQVDEVILGCVLPAGLGPGARAPGGARRRHPDTRARHHDQQDVRLGHEGDDASARAIRRARRRSWSPAAWSR